MEIFSFPTRGSNFSVLFIYYHFAIQIFNQNKISFHVQFENFSKIHISTFQKYSIHLISIYFQKYAHSSKFKNNTYCSISNIIEHNSNFEFHFKNHTYTCSSNPFGSHIKGHKSSFEFHSKNTLSKFTIFTIFCNISNIK